MTRVTVHIDRLILRGIPHKDRYTFADALQQELVQMFSNPANIEHLSTLRNQVHLKVGDVTQSADGGIQQLGTETARIISKGLLP